MYQLSNKLYAVKDDLENGVALDVAAEPLHQILDSLEDLKWEEEYYMDNIPENLQGSSRYDMAEEACFNLDNAYDSVNDAIGDYDASST